MRIPNAEHAFRESTFLHLVIILDDQSPELNTYNNICKIVDFLFMIFLFLELVHELLAAKLVTSGVT